MIVSSKVQLVYEDKRGSVGDADYPREELFTVGITDCSDVSSQEHCTCCSDKNSRKGYYCLLFWLISEFETEDHGELSR